MGEHRCAGIPPAAFGGQKSLIPYELLLSFLFSHQPLLLCLCLVLHSRTSFNSPYFRFVHTSPRKILLSMPASDPSSSVLPLILLPFPPMYFFSLLHFLFSYFTSFPLLPIFVPHFFSQNPVKHARSRSLLQRTSSPFHLPFPPVLHCIVDFASFVFVLCFSSPVFNWVFPEKFI